MTDPHSRTDSYSAAVTDTVRHQTDRSEPGSVGAVVVVVEMSRSTETQPFGFTAALNADRTKLLVSEVSQSR